MDTNELEAEIKQLRVELDDLEERAIKLLDEITTHKIKLERDEELLEIKGIIIDN